MDVYDLLDTTIKIGLGAAASGISAYVLARQSHRSEMRKAAVLRRMDILEKASERSEEFMRAWRELTGTLGGMFEGLHPPKPYFSEAQWKSVMAADEILMQAKDQIYAVVAGLRLIGATEPVKYLNEINLAIGSFRDEMMLRHSTPSAEGLRGVRDEVGKLRKQFLSSLSKSYAAF